MIEWINSIELSTAGKTGFFFVSSLLVMAFYYAEYWIKNGMRDFEGNQVSIVNFLLLNHPERTYEAIKRVILICIGGGVIGALDGMTLMQVFAAGMGAGYAAFARRDEK